MQQYDAFIAAGGRSPWLQAICGTPYRCLAEAGGRRLIDYIIEALLSSGRIRSIVVAAPPEALSTLQGTLPANVSLCPAAPTLAATACDAVQYLGADCSAKILGVCDDIPLLTAAGVQDFFNRCEGYPAGQLYYPIIPQAACLEQFPCARRTYGKLRDGVFTGGNMMLMDKAVIPLCQAKADEIFALRKSPLRLANWLGWSFIFKALLHILTIGEAERRFSKIMGISSKAVVTNYAGIGMDVDKPADWQLVAQYLAEQIPHTERSNKNV